MSLGMLDSYGFSCKIEVGVLKIFKGSSVVLTGRLENRPYLLHAKTMVDEASVATDEHQHSTGKRIHLEVESEETLQ